MIGDSNAILLSAMIAPMNKHRRHLLFEKKKQGILFACRNASYVFILRFEPHRLHPGFLGLMYFFFMSLFSCNHGSFAIFFSSLLRRLRAFFLAFSTVL